ncbi:MAG: flippase-like domain-containing protein [Planctomycetes bacterium]|nr:flippase-like domain-containing protein [Planctomycetota bacterium]
MAFVMRAFFRRWWPWLKVVLFVAILFGVGWQFVRILQNEELQKTDQARSAAKILWDEARLADPAGLAGSGALYLLGLGFAAFFWLYLLRVVGEPVPLLPGVRGYYLSHLGKYVPGKGVALLMRTAAGAEAGAAPGAAALAAVYETLTFMAAGALVAAVLVAWLMRDDPAMMGKVLALLVLAGVPILPGVFNFLVRRLSARLVRDGNVLMRDLTGRTLLIGLLSTACGWFFFGASLEAVLTALDPSRPAWSVEGWLRSTAFVAASYVAGFLTPAPGGLGVREFILQELLAPQFGARSVVVVLLLRLLWTVAELVLAAVVWWFPARLARSASEEDAATLAGASGSST